MVYCDLSATIHTSWYQRELNGLNRPLFKKSPEYQKQQHKAIFLQDNPLSCQPVRDTMEALSWEVLPYAAYSSNLAPIIIVFIDGLCTR